MELAYFLTKCPKCNKNNIGFSDSFGMPDYCSYCCHCFNSKQKDNIETFTKVRSLTSEEVRKYHDIVDEGPGIEIPNFIYKKMLAANEDLRILDEKRKQRYIDFLNSL